MESIVGQFTSAAVSDRGLNEGRPQNEDSFLSLAEHGIFAVADGVGGAQAGEVASQMAVEILGEAFINMGQNADPEDTMRIAIDRANGAIFQMSHDIAQLSSMATTLAAVHISGDMATIAHVGDSRVYRSDASGRLHRETDDHSVVEEEVRAGRMTPEQALSHPSRNIISRALGAEESVLPDIKCVLIHPATTFLLCSDGITRHIGDLEIEQLLNSDLDAEEICARMKDTCYSRGAEDNLTAVIIRFPGERTPVQDEAIDAEEPTVQGIRESAATETGTVEHINIPTEEPLEEVEAPAEEAELPAEFADDPKADEPSLMEDPEPEALDASEPEPSAFLSEPSGQTVTPAGSQVSAAAFSSLASDESDAGARSRSPILMLFVGLIIGTAIGAVAGYFLLRDALKQVEAVPPPVITEQKSNNVPLTSFEETRRIVDADPDKFLQAAVATPQEAGDYFWLGRAFLLTGKTIEAKRAFEQAQRLLPEVHETANIRTMSNEIMMALSIIDSPAAVENLKRQVDAEKAKQANGSANTAVNAPAVR